MDIIVVFFVSMLVSTTILTFELRETAYRVLLKSMGDKDIDTMPSSQKMVYEFMMTRLKEYTSWVIPAAIVATPLSLIVSVAGFILWRV